MVTATAIKGRKGGSSKTRTPTEQPDDLQSVAKAKILIALGEGEFAGQLTGKDIYLDGTPIENSDGSKNFGGVAWEFRPGTQAQKYIQGIPGTENEINVGTAISSSTAWTHTFTNTQLSAIRLRLKWPSLFRQEDDGDLVGYSINYAIDLQTDGGAWQTVINTRVTGKTTSGYERSHRIALPQAGTTWTVRLRKITADANSAKIGDAMTLQSYTEVIDAKLRYLSSTFVETQPDNSGEGNNGNEINVLRPEAGAYSANAYAADTMFNTTLSDRLGETEYTDMMTGERKLTSLWMKNTGGHSRINDSTGQLKTKSNRYVLMLGGDFATAFTEGDGAFRFGALAGYGYNHSNTQSSLSRYHAKGSVNGYTTGLYATWYADGDSEQGAYIDGVLQHSWFNNRVNGQLLEEEKYSSKGFSASLESGYVFPMSNDAKSVAWFVQPQAKILWSGIKSKDLKEANGTVVKTEGDNNLTTSLGLKMFIKGHNAIDNQKERNFKPFVEANWLHNMHNRGVVMDGVSVNQSGTRNVGELKLGVEGRMSPEFNITGFVN